MLLLPQQNPVVAGAPATQPGVVTNAQAAEALMRAAAGPADVYQGAVSQRRELRSQVDRLESRRSDLVQELGELSTPAAAKVGIEARLKELDARLSTTEQQLAASEQAVAAAASVPGATVEPPQPPRQGPSEEWVAIPIVFTIFVFFPIAFAYARRIWRRSGVVVSPVPQEVRDRLEQLGQSVESVALEVERIGEGQRFITKLMSESGRSIGAGAAQPIPVPQPAAEQVGVRRGA